MQLLTQNWSFDPFMIIVAVLVVWHEIGLASLARRSRPERTRQRRLRSIWFYGGLAVLLIAVQSPIDYWSDSYFFVHMIQHLLMMFAAPSMIVAGAPWQPLLDGLPGNIGKDATREVMTAGWTRPLRATGGFLLRPWIAVIAFNFVMLIWHIPALFDLATNNQIIHIWLMHGSYFAVGVLFWLQFLPSAPFRIKLPPIGQVLALVMTNGIIWMLAMSMSLLTRASWYSVYAHVPGAIMRPFADQQLGAAILWVCGDFWAIPTLIYVIRKVLDDDGGVTAAVDKILGRGATAASHQWANRGTGS